MRSGNLRVVVRILWMAAGCALAGMACQAAETPAAPVLTIQDLGKGAVKLDGPWQFHLGDDPSYAAPGIDDATGHDGWEQITANAGWGAQGHRSYTGYAWYRKRVAIRPAAGVTPDWWMLIPRIRDIYSIYWNGRLVVTRGKFPPDPEWPWTEPPQTYSLGRAGDGVLAVRVYAYPMGSYGTGLGGGIEGAPVVGSAGAIDREEAAWSYDFLRSSQLSFGVISLEALVMLLALIGWWRDRSQRLLLYTSLFCCGRIAVFAFGYLNLPWSYRLVQGIVEPFQFVVDVSLMYLLLWLLDLRGDARLARWTRWIAIGNGVFQFADGATCILDWSNAHLTLSCQWSDAICTVLYTLTELWPVVLVLFAARRRLDAPRWLVAVFACLSQLSFVVPITLAQGARFTHWTIGRTLLAPLFTIAGNSFDLNNLASLGLLISIVYAVFAYSRQVLLRKQTMEQELRAAQELLQVLIPEALPSLPGYALTSSYQPAAEVGGDFFQIIPAAGQSYVIAIGDVSGKGLRAAMAVSLIVGTLRTLVETDPAPGAILAGLNRRLHNRLQGGFATCLVLRLDGEGRCTVANAGHPVPFLNGREVALAGSLPLGVREDTVWEEAQLQLHIEDYLVLYTDGLLEARNARGEIFSFDRLAALAADRPSAEQALKAAQAFGQEDDITVLTLTRLAVGEEATSELIAPVLVPA